MNDENERKKRTDEGKLVNKEIHSISKEEVSSGMKRMQNGKVVQRKYLWSYGCF